MRIQSAKRTVDRFRLKSEATLYYAVRPLAYAALNWSALILFAALVSVARELSGGHISLSNPGASDAPTTAFQVVVLVPLLETGIIWLLWQGYVRIYRLRYAEAAFAALLSGLAWLSHGMHFGALVPAIGFAVMGYYYASTITRHQGGTSAALWGAFLIHALFNVAFALKHGLPLV